MSDIGAEVEKSPKFSKELATSTDAENGYLAPSLKQSRRNSQDSPNQTDTHKESEEPSNTVTAGGESRGFSVRWLKTSYHAVGLLEPATDLVSLFQWVLVVVSTLSSILLYALDNTITADVIPVCENARVCSVFLS